MPPKPEPRISVFCRCGAQWHGKVAVNNKWIEAHRDGTAPRQRGRPRCKIVSAADFIAAGHLVKYPRGFMHDGLWS
jgi:hypothetical protein